MAVRQNTIRTISGWARRFCLVALIIMTAAHAEAAPASADPGPPDPGLGNMSEGIGWHAALPTISAQLDSIHATTRGIFNELNQPDLPLGTDTLASLGHQAQTALDSANSLDTQIASYQSVYENYLKIVGATAVTGEDASITTQRKQIQSQLAEIHSASTRTHLYALQAKQLLFEINRRDNSLHHALLSEHLASPLTPAFWKNLIDELPGDRRAFVAGSHNTYPGPFRQWPYFLALLATTAVIVLGISRPSLSGLSRLRTVVAKRFGHPDEVDTDISLLPPALNGIVCAVVAGVIWNIGSIVLALNQNESAALQQLIGTALPICGFLIGAGVPILSRATSIHETPPHAPRALRGIDWMMATAILIQNILLYLNDEYILGLTTLRAVQGGYAIVIATVFLLVCRRLSRAGGEGAHLAPPIRGLAFLIVIVTWLSVLNGYIAFAFQTVAWLVSFGAAVAILSLFALCIRELAGRLLQPQTLLATRLLPLGVSGQRVSQFGVLASGVGNILLLIVLLAVAQSDGNLSTQSVSTHLRNLFVGQTISGVPVSFNTILICIGIVIVAYYGIRQICVWMRDRLFPTTQLDIGARSSIISIFTYTAWIAIFLIVLSEAGLTMKNLTWVVSALSVGIGFGLQSIVQNFVSGVILLAERPIRVGDMITIGGSQGDVRRISVRSTEIGLSDGAVMIVPNSQFITSSVTNATRFGTQGTISMAFTISQDTDIEQARQLLRKVVADRPEVLESPIPTVNVTAVAGDNVTLTVSAKVASPRMLSSVRSAIVIDAYQAFNEEKMTIATA